MNWTLFIAGFIGALAPEIVRLYKLRQQPRAFPTYYLGVSAVYALLGGYVATIAPGVTAAWWAFCVGAGLNAVVSTAARWGAERAAGGGGLESEPATQLRRGAGQAPDEGTWQRFVRAF